MEKRTDELKQECVIMEVCSYRLCQLHLGYKLAHTARTYNMTVNHRRRILNTTKGHPARFNDKTLVLFDLLVNQIHDGKVDDSKEVTLRNNWKLQDKHIPLYIP